MTLDEAIKHAKDKAQEQRYYAYYEKNPTMYRSCISCAEEHEQLAEWLEELKEYEDLEEKGLLKKFDCAIGDTVYRIDRHYEICECIVTGIKQQFNTTSYLLHINFDNDNYNTVSQIWFDRCQIGYEFYLTKEEAEKELKRLEGAE